MGMYADIEGDGDRCKEFAMVPSIPRPIPSSVHRRELLLALPPSSNCPAAFLEMYYQSTTTVNQPLVSDVIPQILQFCDAKTLSRASCVCRSWSLLANADELWTQLCKEVFGVAPSQLTPPPDPTRMLYIMSHLKLRETLSFKVGAGQGFSSRWNNNMLAISTAASWATR